MAGKGESLGKDVLRTCVLVWKGQRRKLFYNWVVTPASCVFVMVILWGLRLAIRTGGVKLPANIILLLAFFALLLLLDAVLPERVMARIVRGVAIPLGFFLRYINLFFTPPFIELPVRAEPISGKEVGIISAVFLLGWLATTGPLAWFVRGYNLLEEKRQYEKRLFSSVTRRFSRDKRAFSSSTAISTSTTLAGDDLENGKTDTPGSEASEQTDPQTQQVWSAPKKETVGPAPAVDIEAGTQELPDRARRWAGWILRHFDHLTWATLFLSVGLPTFYTTFYAMPAILPLNVLIFFACNELPRRPGVPGWVRQLLHPIITTTGFTILAIWFLACTKAGFAGGVPVLKEQLLSYKIGVDHHHLFDPVNRHTLSYPGAGDFLSALLEVSVVAFALPMYTYRSSLKKYFIPLILGVIIFCFTCLLAYPPLCRALGLDPAKSLAFSARSVSMPLAILVAENLNPMDAILTAALAALSGVIGALFGIQYLRLWGIPDDDFVARGISLGCNSAAPMTALLLEVDPPAGALSSLSLSLLGVLMILLTLIPQLADTLRSFAGVG